MENQELIKVLEQLRDKVRNKLNSCSDEMTFCREHNFMMEFKALGYKKEAYDDILGELLCMLHNLYLKG